MGELSVDLSRFGWFPSVLPSEEGELESSSGGDDDEEVAAYHA
jgi:methylated-DNA-protein-cysteine methyltransferase-like protein